MSNKINVFDNVSLFAIPEANNHLVTKAYADSSLGASGAMMTVTNPVLSLTKAGQVFYLSVVSNSAVSVDVSDYTFSTNEIIEFTLIIFTTGASISFSGWNWHNGITPDLSSAGWYVIHCTSVNSGANWLAKLEGSYSFPAKYKWVTTLSDATSHTGTSLRDAVSNAVSGDVIMFAPNLEGSCTLAQGAIAISTSNITINGGSKITIDGNNTSRIFEVSGNDCRINNLTMTKGKATATMGGGAIYATGSVSLTGCTFTNNTVDVTSGRGGACTFSAAATVSKCTFVENTTSTYGGAVCSHNTTLTMTDCAFTDNQALASSDGRGGAVYAASGQTSNWIFTGCTFTNNSARARGGAVNHEGLGTLTITNCVFRTNTVTQGNGGAMNIGSTSHPSVVVSGCTFENNACSYSSGNTGVANIYQCRTAEISDCVFRGNTSIGTVPVLRFYGYSSQGLQKVLRCLFTENSGSGTTNDGLIYLASNVTVNVADSVFTGNTWPSGKSGYHACAGQFSGTTTLNVVNCTFTNNTNMISLYGTGSSSTATYYNCVDVGNGGKRYTVSSFGGVTLSNYLSDKTGDSHDITYNSSLPLFESDGYTPATGSQVIDAGDDTLVTSTTDFNGEDRIQGDAVDLGAVEFLLPAIQGLSFSNNSPQSSPIIYQENTSYPVDELVEVEGVEQGDTVNYNVENFLYGGNDVPVIDTPGTYVVTVTVSRSGYRKSRSVNTVAIKKNTGTLQLVEGTIYAGDVGVVTASVSSDANGYLTCELNGETYTGTISNGTGEIQLENIPVGTYPAIMIAHCTNYIDMVITDTISVIKRPGSLYLSASGVDMGENITLSGIVPGDFDGIVSCTFEGTTYTASPSNGSFTMYIPTTTGGEYTLVVYATGSSKYNDVSESTIIEVTDNRSNSTLTLSASDVYIGQNLVINGVVSDAGGGGGGFVIPDAGGGGDGGEILLEDAGDPTPCDFDGTATCTFEGNTYTATITDGEFTLSLPTTTAGSVTINVTASGSSSFKNATESVSATIMAKVTPSLSLSASGVAVGSNIVVNGTVPNDYDGTASCTFEGTTYTASPSGGSFTFNIPTTTTGSTTLTVSLSATTKYNSTSNTATVNVTSASVPLTLTLSVSENSISVGNTLVISGSVSPTNITNGVATIVFDSNDTHTVNIDANGAFSYSTSTLAAGTHTIEVTVSGDGCTSDSDTASITVIKKSSNMSVSSKNPTTTKPGGFTVVLPSDATGTCTAVSSTGGTFSGPVLSGKCKISIEYGDMPTGTHNFVITYSGDDTYASDSKTSNIAQSNPK